MHLFGKSCCWQIDDHFATIGDPLTSLIQLGSWDLLVSSFLLSPPEPFVLNAKAGFPVTDFSLNLNVVFSLFQNKFWYFVLTYIICLLISFPTCHRMFLSFCESALIF
ncbi:hypothetical protein Ancab_030495 [Ancistrocladus abbreviatus]